MLTVKGSGSKIDLHFDAQTLPEEAITQIQSLKESAENFFTADGEMCVSYSGIELGYREEVKMQQAIKKTLGRGAKLLSHNPLTDKELLYSFEKDEALCRIVRRTVRSGEMLTSRGDILIYGDVNPGAVIRVRGNITVLGALRGTARTKKGTVYARYMNPVQIQIGNIISYNKKTENVGSAVATAKKGEIIVECF